MKRPRANWVVAFILVVTGTGWLSSAQPAQASHTGPCVPTPITSPEVANMVTTPAGMVVPATSKSCVQSAYNTGGLDNVSTIWLSPDAFSVPVGAPVLNATFFAANVNFNSSPVPTVDFTLQVLDSKVDWPVQDGFYDASNVMNFAPGGTTFPFGAIPRGSSKGVSAPVTIDTSKLKPGRNIITVFVRGTWVYGPGNNCTPVTAVVGTCVDDFQQNIIVDYTPVAPPADFNVAPFFSGGSAPLPGGTLQAGQTYTIDINAQNTGLGPSQDVYVDVPVPAGIVGSAAGQTPGTFGGSGYSAGCGPTATPGCSSPHWHWNKLGSLPPAGLLTGSFQFMVSPTAPAGPLCFDAYAYFVNMAHNPPYSSAQICWVVDSPRFPFLTTTGGDVHAGGGIGLGLNCAAGSGNVNGQSSPAGLDPTEVEYIISANGVINNDIKAPVSLANTPTRGHYGTVCRPDLVAEANAYPLARKFAYSGNLHGVPTKEMLTAGPVGPCTHIAGGTISTGSQITLYVTGNVCIDGDIVYDPTATSIATLPSFGLIATGDIMINNSVGRLHGYYFANGAIDTCYNEPNIAANPNNCSNTLVVKGLMMANSFRLARTGSGGGSVPAESVNFIGDLYLAPPPGFTDSITPRVTRPEFEGERAPLY